MFICSVRATTLKFIGIAVLSVALLLTVLVFSDNGIVASAEASVSYSGISTAEERIAFLQKFGWTVREEAVSEETFTIPETFDRVMLGYNEIQKSQGLDLTRYRKKKVTRYTYEVTNYADYEGVVYANLIIFRNRVIAVDLCSADPLGFVRGVENE